MCQGYAFSAFWALLSSIRINNLRVVNLGRKFESLSLRHAFCFCFQLDGRLGPWQAWQPWGNTPFGGLGTRMRLSESFLTRGSVARHRSLVRVVEQRR